MTLSCLDDVIMTSIRCAQNGDRRHFDVNAFSAGKTLRKVSTYSNRLQDTARPEGFNPAGAVSRGVASNVSWGHDTISQGELPCNPLIWR